MIKMELRHDHLWHLTIHVQGVRLHDRFVNCRLIFLDMMIARARYSTGRSRLEPSGPVGTS